MLTETAADYPAAPDTRRALETTKIHSVAGKLGKHASLVSVRPFRSPHHTIERCGPGGGGMLAARRDIPGASWRIVPR